MQPDTQPTRPDPDRFRTAMSFFPTGVTVITATTGDQPHGMTANAFTSVSLDPPLVMVAVARTARMLTHVIEAGAFAVTILSAEQRDDAAWFATPGRPAGVNEFQHRPWRVAPVSGAPVLTDGLAWLDCRLVEVYPTGDHELCIGLVEDLDVLDPDRRPLRWFRAAFA